MRRVCGICGILDPATPPSRRADAVERMMAAMVHRGPDDRGHWTGDEVDLGFRRLAVIDLVTGNQPLRLEDDRAVLVLNGEIYNFRELRRDLEARGHAFRTKGDVEVALRLYAEAGIASVGRLRGMFALALWDRRMRTLFLARDRYGIKPLYVARHGARVAFASEIAPLLAGGGIDASDLDPRQIRRYLAQKYTDPSATILRAVTQVPPATVLEIGPSGARSWRYWTPPSGPFHDDTAGRSAEERLETMLRDAVRRQLVADVPVGVFLSGGIDSSTLAALVREVGDGPLETFAVGFEGPGSVSELPWAARVAARLGSVHHELPMDPRRVAEDLDAIVERLDGPVGDATALPTWYLSRLARERVTVALSGEGADEVFGGYPRQAFDVLIDRVGPLGRALVPIALRASGARVSTRLAKRLRAPKGLARQLDWSRVFTAEGIDALDAGALPPEDEAGGDLAELAARWRATEAHDPVNARLLADLELFLAGDLLPKVDRMSMAHSLEVRVPYLDEEVVDLVASLPGHLKIRGRRGKRLLRRVAARVLPQEILARPKQGFDVPIGAWLRGPLRAPLTDYLAEDAVRRRGLFRPEAVGGLMRSHLAGEADHGDALWLLLALEAWMRRVLDRPWGTA